MILLAKAKTSPRARFQMPWFEMMVAPVAFTAWAFALPDTPLSEIAQYGLKWNAAILMVTTTAIVLVANALHKSPDYDQVVTMAQGANPDSPVINTSLSSSRTSGAQPPAAVTGSLAAPGR